MKLKAFFVLLSLACCCFPAPCSDYYDFFQVQAADFEFGGVNSAVPGETVRGSFEARGTLGNPLPSSKVMVQVSSQYGVHDSFFLSQALEVGRNQSQEFNFTWFVPRNIPPGEISFNVYAFSNGFPFGGFPERPWLSAGSGTLLVNTAANSFIGFNFSETVVSALQVSFTLHNHGEAAQVPVALEFFAEGEERHFELKRFKEEGAVPQESFLAERLEAVEKANLLASNLSPVSLEENGSSVFSFDFTDASLPPGKYFAKFTAFKGDWKTSTFALILVSGEGASFSAVGVNEFPLKQGDSARMFACSRAFQETFSAVLQTQFSSAGKKIAKVSLPLNLSEGAEAAGGEFTAQFKVEQGILSAKLFDANNSLLDIAVAEYHSFEGKTELNISLEASGGVEELSFTVFVNSSSGEPASATVSVHISNLNGSLVKSYDNKEIAGRLAGAIQVPEGKYVVTAFLSSGETASKQVTVESAIPQQVQIPVQTPPASAEGFSYTPLLIVGGIALLLVLIYFYWIKSGIME